MWSSMIEHAWSLRESGSRRPVVQLGPLSRPRLSWTRSPRTSPWVCTLLAGAAEAFHEIHLGRPGQGLEKLRF